MICENIRAASAYSPPAPFDWAFNIAARHLAALHAPGWISSDDAPAEYGDLAARFARDGFVTVWTGASEGTVFDDPETNWAFRAWHDAAHIRHALPFTLEGEVAAAYVQAADIVGEYGDGGDSVAMVSLLLCEVIGQAKWFARHGAFPADQMAFARANYAGFHDEAGALVARLALRDDARPREARALALARRSRHK